MKPEDIVALLTVMNLAKQWPQFQAIHDNAAATLMEVNADAKEENADRAAAKAKRAAKAKALADAQAADDAARLRAAPPPVLTQLEIDAKARSDYDRLQQVLQEEARLKANPPPVVPSQAPAPVVDPAPMTEDERRA